MDWIHGTSVGPDVVDDLKDEADKPELRNGEARLGVM